VAATRFSRARLGIAQAGFFVKEVLAVKSKTQKPGTVNVVAIPLSRESATASRKEFFLSFSLDPPAI
jgi:hypothetical protein